MPENVRFCGRRYKFEAGSFDPKRTLAITRSRGIRYSFEQHYQRAVLYESVAGTPPQDEIHAYMLPTGFASIQLTITKKRNNIVNEEV